MPELIYKITTAEQWAEAEQLGKFRGAPIDIRDGYIHFSTAEQVRETARLHFSGQDNLLLVAVDPRLFGEKLKYEASRGGQLFPHLYDELTLDSVVWSRHLPLGEDGIHNFPAAIDRDR